MSCLPWRLPAGSANLRVSRKVVTLDVPVTTIMRAPGESNGSFALEGAMDELADELGMDPLDCAGRTAQQMWSS
ncbi:molybdopterin cofactor-binding domain-containing protein [Nonomuraea sp. NPDC049480]|uniref:molybdopterin cofactor-binding domain-containing protein n=1 Tax=Nonomuraea sp. NPDC049480 TaxID=3364353 RepID=UPI00379D8EA2